MKIGFYAPLKPVDHPVPSGDRRMARLLLRILQECGHEVSVLSTLRSWEGKGDVQKQQEIQALAEEELVRIREQGLDSGLDLVFVYHLYHKAPDWIGLEIALALEIPYVLAEASYAPKQAGGPWNSGHLQVEKCLRRANAIISLNPVDNECILKLVKSHCSIEHIPPFLEPVEYEHESDIKDRDRHRERICRHHGLDSQDVLLVAVAMMRRGDKISSYRMLASAVSDIQLKNWKLVLIGDGDSRSEVEEMFASVSDHCLFVGELEAGEITQWLHAGDIYVWPSVNEAYGLALLEAVALGLPAIVCDYGGVGQIVEHDYNGIVTNPGDLSAFTRALETMMKDRGLRGKYAANANRKFLRDHSYQQAKSKIGMIVNGILPAQ